MGKPNSLSSSRPDAVVLSMSSNAAAKEGLSRGRPRSAATTVRGLSEKVSSTWLLRVGAKGSRIEKKIAPESKEAKCT